MRIVHRYAQACECTTLDTSDFRASRGPLGLRQPRGRVAIAGWVAWLVLMATPGCTLWLNNPPAQTKDGVSPLRPVGEGSVTIEIYAARFPLGDVELNGPVWEDIDEQSLPVDVRRELAAHGIRAGVITSQTPPAIARAFNMTDGPVNNDPLATDVSLDKTPTVTKRRWTLASGHTMEYQASPVYPELSVLLPDGGGLAGEQLDNAQAFLQITPTVQPDGRVDLDVLPELKYGQPRPQVSMHDGITKIVTDKPKKTFSQLRLKSDLSVGQILVLSCLPDRSRSLGHHFFTETAENGKLQKIVLIRLTQSPRDAQFSGDLSPSPDRSDF